jgi:sulfite exporter TauE/SafE
MTKVFSALIIIIGVMLVLIGFAGMFRPERVAEVLGFALTNSEATGQIRAIFGGHHLAMGAVCIYAVLRQRLELLLPIGAIEAFILVGRGLAGLNGEFGRSAIAPTIIEVFVATLLIFVSLRAARR